MDITEDNYVAGLQAKNEKALYFFIEHDGWIVKSIVHKMMAKYPDKQEECMNDIFLAVWRNADRYTGEKASFRTWLTAVARNASTVTFAMEKKTDKWDAETKEFVGTDYELVSEPYTVELTKD